MVATRDEILAALEANPGKEEFTFPNCSTVFIEELTATEIEEWRMELAKEARNVDAGEWDAFGAVRLIIRCVTDGAGNTLLSHGDVKKIGRGRGSIVEQLYRRCMRINGLDSESQKELKKNYDAKASTNGSLETVSASTD